MRFGFGVIDVHLIHCFAIDHVVVAGETLIGHERQRVPVGRHLGAAMPEIGLPVTERASRPAKSANIVLVVVGREGGYECSDVVVAEVKVAQATCRCIRGAIPRQRAWSERSTSDEVDVFAIFACPENSPYIGTQNISSVVVDRQIGQPTFIPFIEVISPGPSAYVGCPAAATGDGGGIRREATTVGKEGLFAVAASSPEPSPASAA